MRSHADWFKHVSVGASARAADRLEQEAKAREAIAARFKAAASAALAVERREAFHRLALAHGWKGGRTMAGVIPIEERRIFTRFWNAMGAPACREEA
jgi:hypothetical protein